MNRSSRAWSHAPDARIRRGLVLLASLVAAILGALLVSLAAWTRYVEIASPDWPTADGVVRSADLFHYDGNVHFEIDVEYVVDGLPYHCETLRGVGKGVSVGSIEEGRALAARYPVGSHVPVSYRPGSPGTSTVAPGSSGSTRVLALSGSAMLLLAALVQHRRIARFLRRLARTFRRDVRAQLDLVNHLIRDGELHEALDVLDALEHRAPDVAELFRLRGMVHSRLARFDLALRAFERALELDPTDAYARGWLDSARVRREPRDRSAGTSGAGATGS